MNGPAGLWSGLSLRLKLTLGYALVFSVTVLAGSFGIYHETQHLLIRSMDATLRDTVRLAQANIVNIGSRAGFSSTFAPGSDLRIELLGHQGQTLARTGDDQYEVEEEDRAQPQQAAPLGVPQVATLGSRRVLTQWLGRDLYLRVSLSVSGLNQFMTTLAGQLMLGSVLMIAAACAAGYWLAHRALKPVDAVARTAQRISQRGDYAERVPQAPGRDEMANLTRTVNAMLDQLSGTIDREKEFARIAAHELRTPLTTLRGRLDLTLERPRTAAEYERALQGMRGRVADLGALTESLLALARTDAPLRLERVELAALALKCSENLEETARQAGKAILLHLEETWVEAEPDGAERVISNLLENALKYGSGDVHLRVQGQSLSVQDGGLGPAQEDWEQLLQPFERGAGRQGTQGSGLGLALIAALVRRWNAELVPEWKDKGFTVRVRF